MLCRAELVRVVDESDGLIVRETHNPHDYHPRPCIDVQATLSHLLGSGAQFALPP
jgi:hypothetical protein